MAFFIGIACPWILVVILNKIAEDRRGAELSALGVKPPPATVSSYLTKPDRPY